MVPGCACAPGCIHEGYVSAESTAAPERRLGEPPIPEETWLARFIRADLYEAKVRELAETRRDLAEARKEVERLREAALDASNDAHQARVDLSDDGRYAWELVLIMAEKAGHEGTAKRARAALAKKGPTDE